MIVRSWWVVSVSLLLVCANALGQTATLTGTVTDMAGGVIPGAKVVLHSASGADQETVSGDEGTFRFDKLEAGTSTVTASAQHFAKASRTVELADGEAGHMAPIALLLTISEVVDVDLPLYQQAEEDIYLEEHQRVVGVLPNFLVSYRWRAAPLSSGQKYRLMAKNLFDPGNLLLVGTVAGVEQGMNDFAGYHQGAAGYAKRFGAGAGNLAIGSVLGSAVYPSLFHQDPRYFYRGTGSLPKRAWYAVTRAVVTRGDNGREQPNYSGVLGNFSAAGLSNLYYPRQDRRGVWLTVDNGLLGIAGDVLNGLVQEFVFSGVTTGRPHSKTKTADTP